MINHSIGPAEYMCAANKWKLFIKPSILSGKYPRKPQDYFIVLNITFNIPLNNVHQVNHLDI